jgi:hypothetical protein
MRWSVRWSMGSAVFAFLGGWGLYEAQLPKVQTENEGAALGHSGIGDRGSTLAKQSASPSADSSSEEQRRQSPSEPFKAGLQESPGPMLEPEGYAGPERWRRTPVPCWGVRGTTPEDYEVVSDPNEHTVGHTSVLLSSTRSLTGWGTLYQFADAEPLRGKRIEFSADLRTFGVGNTANLFVRVDDASGTPIALDNMLYSYGEPRSDVAMLNRGLSGDTDWTSTNVVLDIPADAHAISYGVALVGSGKVWVDNAHIETVAAETPITAFPRTKAMLEGMPAFRMREVPTLPRNLDFEPATACK